MKAKRKVMIVIAALLCASCGKSAMMWGDGTADAAGETDAPAPDAAADALPDGVADPGYDSTIDPAWDPGADVIAETVEVELPPTDVVVEPETAPPPECPAPTVRCGDVCVDVSGDPVNCGACGAGCAGGEPCVSGICGGRPVCEPGYVNCGWGDCRDVSGDPENCGGCEVSCRALEYCSDGECVCRPGLVPCGGGCVSTASDPANCGGCGAPCGGVCVDGACATADACTRTVCGAACVDTAADPRNCGGCNRRCEVDQLCIRGRCRDYEPAVGCVTCEDCRSCWRETCCDIDPYGATCVDGDGRCP